MLIFAHPYSENGRGTKKKTSRRIKNKARKTFFFILFAESLSIKKSHKSWSRSRWKLCWFSKLLFILFYFFSAIFFLFVCDYNHFRQQLTIGIVRNLSTVNSHLNTFWFIEWMHQRLAVVDACLNFLCSKMNIFYKQKKNFFFFYLFWL